MHSRGSDSGLIARNAGPIANLRPPLKSAPPVSRKCQRSSNFPKSKLRLKPSLSNMATRHHI